MINFFCDIRARQRLIHFGPGIIAARPDNTAGDRYVDDGFFERPILNLPRTIASQISPELFSNTFSGGGASPVMLIAQSQLPEPGQLVHLRQRRWLVEAVDEAPRLDEVTLVHTACVDDDAQGEPVSVPWEHELGARVIEDAGWRRAGQQRFDDPELFAAYARTVRWGCVTATDPSLFQAPFRAGICLDAYQLEPLRKIQLPRVNPLIANDFGHICRTLVTGVLTS
jgi:hypothetical protein